MTTVSNKTHKPLRVPLPGGKTLHLGAGKTGEITAKAVDHPPLQKLVEAGEIEIQEGTRKSGGKGSAPSSGQGSPQSRDASGGIRHTGDR